MNMSLYKNIEFIKETSSDELFKKHLKIVFKTHYEVFGEVCSGCPTKIAGYIKKLKNFKISELMKKTESNFQLKKGKLIIFSGQSNGYSNANLTDEVAIKFLKGKPNRKALFAKLPENVDELINVDETKTEDTGVKKLSDYKVAELRELYPEAKGRSKDDLIASIQESINAAALNDETKTEDTGEADSKNSDEEE